MMLALLLAQIVLPSAPSGPIHPPGMICLGACAGPVIYGAAEQRGRLVVACDMTSDTCSDGRQITTSRASPVPCEVSPGVWEIVPEDEGCYGVRGLESWAQNTSYLSYGAELDRSPWAPLRGGTIEALPDGYRITNDPAQTSTSGIIQVLGSLPAESAVTLACIVRTQDPIARLTLEAGTGVSRSWTNFDTQGQWETISVSGTVAAGASRWAAIAPRGPDLASVDVQACWYTHTDTPGRPCWGGEAPVTCAGDRHTISTEGWPTESGEICVVASITERLPTAPQYFFDGRIASSSVAARLFISSTSGAPLILAYGPDQVVVSSALEWEEAKDYSICVRRDAVSGTVSLLRNGVVVGAASAPPLPWLESVHLGSAFNAAVLQFLDGSLGPIRIRSTE